MEKAQIIFDSRSLRCKKPCGAVPSGTVLSLSLFVEEFMDPEKVFLVIRFDDDSEPARCPMTASGRTAGADGYIVYKADFTADRKGLYWYHFELEKDGGTIAVGRNEYNRAVIADPAPQWQQTVYEKTYEEPEWIFGGIFYHIFVDRFRHAGERVEMEGKITRDAWGETPEWRAFDGIMYNNDFFGGNLEGIREKLPYLKELGVTCLYLSPIAEAYSNHKYDTGDYTKVDPMFGTMEDFERLCRDAEAEGIRVILDGVFSHTGADSVYFNKYGHYGDGGAYRDPYSPYRSWYYFDEEGNYQTWWGIDTLPRLNKDEPAVNEFFNGENGIVRYWLKHGASGWRLDVADELPSAFLTDLVKAAKTEKPDAMILGEVWEDASNKTAYEERKNYFRGDRLDSVMNYPLKDAVIRCVRYGEAHLLKETAEQLWENYPHYVVHSLMNHLGTHDSVRILTALAGKELPPETPREILAHTCLDERGWREGVRLLKLAVVLQMTLPGVPCVYYGDEAGMEGYKDPFNRKCYPWDYENQDLLSWYKKIAAIRRGHEVYKKGEYRTTALSGGMFAFARYDEAEEIITVVNCGAFSQELYLTGLHKDLLSGRTFTGLLAVAPGEVFLLKRQDA